MKASYMLLQLAVLLLLANPATATTADTCATTSAGTTTQYINAAITLKILLVEFTDVHHRTSPSAYTKADFENLLGSNGVYVSPNMYSPDGEEVYGSLRDYFSKMSSGNVTVSPSVVNNVVNGIPVWIALPNTKAYYHSFQYWNTPSYVRSWKPDRCFSSF